VHTLPPVPWSTQPSTLCGTVNEYQLSGWVIINGDGGCRRLQTLSPSQVAWSEGQRSLGALLHSPDELSELSQWPWGHDDSTINIILVIIIIIITRHTARLCRANQVELYRTSVKIEDEAMCCLDSGKRGRVQRMKQKPVRKLLACFVPYELWAHGLKEWTWSRFLLRLFSAVSWLFWLGYLYTNFSPSEWKIILTCLFVLQLGVIHTNCF